MAAGAAVAAAVARGAALSSFGCGLLAAVEMSTGKVVEGAACAAVVTAWGVSSLSSMRLSRVPVLRGTPRFEGISWRLGPASASLADLPATATAPGRAPPAERLEIMPPPALDVATTVVGLVLFALGPAPSARESCCCCVEAEAASRSGLPVGETGIVYCGEDAPGPRGTVVDGKYL